MGGVASATVALGEALRSRGHIVTLVSFDSPNAPFLAANALPLGPALPGYGWLPWLSLKLKAHEKSFDMLILNGLWLHSTHGVGRWARQNQIPYLLFPHGMLDRYFRQFPLKHFKKFLYWLFFERHTVAGAQALCYTTVSEQTYAQKTFPFFNPKRQVVVGMGLKSFEGSVSLAKEEFFQRFPTLKDKHFILYLSRFHPKKAPHLILKALKKLPSLHLVMAGPQEDTAYYHALRSHPQPLPRGGVKDRGLLPYPPCAATPSVALPQVTWSGLLTGSIKWGALASADALILPSHQENFGMVVAEALSVGTPVLISDKVALAEEVMKDQAGLVADDTLQGVELLLKRFSSLSVDELAAMRARASHCYQSHYQPAVVAERLERLMKET
jgi:glycosyltransferase involved in cell wall biosynthesis